MIANFLTIAKLGANVLITSGAQDLVQTGVDMLVRSSGCHEKAKIIGMRLAGVGLGWAVADAAMKPVNNVLDTGYVAAKAYEEYIRQKKEAEANE